MSGISQIQMKIFQQCLKLNKKLVTLNEEDRMGQQHWRGGRGMFHLNIEIN